MIPFVFALVLEFAAPPETPPAKAKAPVSTPPAAAEKKKDTVKGKKATEPPKGPKPPAAPARDERQLMLQNREFLQMLDLLIDLPLLADDDELEKEPKK